MVIMSIRSKHHRHTRLLRLQKTALQHIAQYGINGLKLHKIAKELGYTTAALYRYYPSKEALIEALEKRSLEDMQRSLAKLLQEASLSPLGRILLCTTFYVQYSRNSPTSFSLNSSVFAHPTAVLEGERRDLKPTIPTIRKALCIWSALHGLLLTHKYRADFLVPVESDLIPSLLIGWGATTEQLEEAQTELAIFLKNISITSFTTLDISEAS